METRLGPTEPSEILDAIIGAIHHEFGRNGFPTNTAPGLLRVHFAIREAQNPTSTMGAHRLVVDYGAAAYSAIDPAQR